MTYLVERSSGACAGSFRLCGASLRGLFDAASQGRGSHELASTTYRSADWSLVGTAFHEAGHFSVARACGVWAEIDVRAPGEGRCLFTPPKSKAQMRSIGLAGAIAEHLSIYGYWEPDKEIGRCAPCFLSDTDRAIAGPFDIPEILDCRRQVQLLWTEICREAANVINQQLKEVAHAP